MVKVNQTNEWLMNGQNTKIQETRHLFARKEAHRLTGKNREDVGGNAEGGRAVEDEEERVGGDAREVDFGIRLTT